jgi:hypothetical protein
MSVEQPKKIIYPDQLNITINTSVPGYQKIIYKPNMTIKDSDEKTVKFNPLIRLNKSVIEKIPKEYQIKQFFNKGLFQSLLNVNGGIPAKSLLQATRSGNVDNNIKITLNAIFPIGSVIYIGKKPYAIGDIQWTNGDWKMDIKQKKEEIDINKVTEPRLYTQLVKEEIISGEDELSQIPETLRTGNNYSGPPVVVARGIQQPTTTSSTTPTKTSTTSTTSTSPITSSPITTTTSPTTTTSTTTSMPSKPVEQQQLIPRTTSKPVRQQIVNQENEDEENILPESPFVEELSPEEQNLCNLFNETFHNKKSKSTNFIRNYFKIGGKSVSKFPNIIQKIFLNFSPQVKEQIKSFLRITTNYIIPPSTEARKLPSISPTSYDKLCDQIDILESSTDGNCFFQAVADGINIYNCENENSKILYKNLYGKTQLFTPLIIREMVLVYINLLPATQIDEMLSVASNYLEDLNKEFEISVRRLENEFGRDLTQTEYLDTINNIYNSHENFLIKKPKSIPIYIDQKYKPFEVLKNNEISNYIMSKDYWANNIAIEALCYVLGICLITVQKYGYTSTLTIKPKQVERLQAILQDKEQVKDKMCFKKIMFLYNSGNHYELIRFTYKNKKNTITNALGNKEIIYTNRFYAIFRYDNIPPPIYMLFLIYGSIYVTISDPEKTNFTIYPTVMKEINDSLMKILTEEENREFIENFNDTFPQNGRSIDTLIFARGRTANSDYSNAITDIDGGSNIFVGGQKPPYGYQQPPYGYQQPPYGYQQPPPYGYRPYYITKKPEEREQSKLAYDITIDMELHPGTSLTPEQIEKSKCNNKYNAIRKSFAEFTGRPYTIPPVYPASNNKTRKNNQPIRGGKHKTRKV